MSKLQPIVWGALTGLSIVAIGWWAKSLGDDPAPEKPPVAELAQPAEVEASQAGPAAQLRTAPARANMGPLPPVDPVAFQAQNIRDRDAAARRLDAVWNADAPAPQLAMQTERKLLESMETGLASQARFQPIASVPRCRANMCRIEGEFAPGEDGNNWATRLLLDMAGTFGNTTTVQYPQPDGRSQLVLYAFRSGKAPPQ
jgi:hypothetical protein